MSFTEHIVAIVYSVPVLKSQRMGRVMNCGVCEAELFVRSSNSAHTLVFHYHLGKDNKDMMNCYMTGNFLIFVTTLNVFCPISFVCWRLLILI